MTFPVHVYGTSYLFQYIAKFNISQQLNRHRFPSLFFSFSISRINHLSVKSRSNYFVLFCRFNLMKHFQFKFATIFTNKLIVLLTTSTSCNRIITYKDLYVHYEINLLHEICTTLDLNARSKFYHL